MCYSLSLRQLYYLIISMIACQHFILKCFFLAIISLRFHAPKTTLLFYYVASRLSTTSLHNSYESLLQVMPCFCAAVRTYTNIPPFFPSVNPFLTPLLHVRLSPLSSPFLTFTVRFLLVFTRLLACTVCFILYWSVNFKSSGCIWCNLSINNHLSANANTPGKITKTRII